MQAFPHHYQVTARSTSAGKLALSSEGLPNIEAAPPAEFDGPGDQWSPETLLLSAASACFVLSFRAVATAAKLDWESLECRTEGELDRVDRITRFTRVTTHASLVIENETDRDKAERLLEKAESICLIANSLNAAREIRGEIKVKLSI